MQEITDAEANKQEEEVKDISNIDKVELIRSGKQMKKKQSGVETKEVIVHGKNYIITGIETRNSIDLSTVKKRIKNYVWYESKIGTEKNVDIVNIEKRKGREIKTPKQLPQKKPTESIEISGGNKQDENSYLIKVNTRQNQPKRQNQTQRQNPQIQINKSYRLTQGQNAQNTGKYSSRPNQTNQSLYQKRTLQSSSSYNLTPGSTIQNNPYRYINPQQNQNYPYKLRSEKKVNPNIHNIGSKLNSYQITKIQPKKREIRTPGPRIYERILIFKKRHDYIDNYQYLEDKSIKSNNPRRHSVVIHKSFTNLIDYFNEPNQNQSNYNKITYNPKLKSQQTTITSTTRKNNPQYESGEFIRTSRIGPKTPAVKSFVSSSIVNRRNNQTSTNWKPSDDGRSKKVETIEKQIMSRRVIVPKTYETRTEIKNSTNLRGSYQPTNIQTNLRPIKVVNSNKPRIDNLETLNTAQTITSTTKISKMNTEKPSKIYVKRPIKTSEESNTNFSSFPPENTTNKIIKVQIIKKEIVDDSNTDKKQYSEVKLDNNLKGRDSIRNKYKFG